MRRQRQNDDPGTEARWPAIPRTNQAAPATPAATSPRLRPWIGAILPTLAAAALYEAVKQIAFPRISPWGSQAITIAVFGLVAAFVYRALRKQAPLLAAYRQAETDRIGLADAMEQASDSIVITDDKGQIEYVNPAFTLMTGYAAPEAIGRSTEILKSGLQSPAFYQDLWNTVGGGRIWHGELVNRRKDGTSYHEAMTITPVRDSMGAIRKYIAIKQDVSARREALEAQSLLASIVEASEDAIIAATPEGVIMSWNCGAEMLYGYTAGEAVGKSMDMLVPPHRIGAFREGAFGRVMRGESVPPYQAVGLRKDGTKFPISASVSPIKDAEGQIKGGAAIIRDMSTLKKAEQAMASLASIVDSAEDAIFSTTLEGTILTWNLGAERLFGYRPIDMIGKDISVLAPPERFAEQMEVIGRVRSGETVAQLETQTVKADGSLAEVSISVSPVTNAAGKVVRCSTVARDISSRKRAEETLRQSEEKYRLLFARHPHPMWVYDPETYRVLAVNEAAVAHYGYSSEEFLGMTILQLRPPEEIPRLIQDVTQFPGELVNRGVRIHRKKDGSLIDVEIAVHNLSFAGRPARLAANIDVTQREKAKRLGHDRGAVVELIAQGCPIDQTMRKLLEMVEHQAPEMRASVVRLDGVKLCYLASSLPADVVQATDGLPTHLNEGSALDEESDPFWRAFRKAALCAGFRTCWAAPIVSPTGSILGAFVVCRRDSGDRSQQEQDLISMAGQVASVAIEQRQLHDRLLFQAHHDILTGLPNRLLLDDRLSQCLARARRGGASFAVLQIDLDRFKLINDCLGHETGDALLKTIGERLNSCVRQTDTLARVVGDEFTVILTDVKNAGDAGMAAEQLLAALRKPFDIQGNETFVTCSIGIAMYPRDAVDAGTLMRKAYAAMYGAKNKGKNRWHSSLPEIAPAGNRLEIANYLHRALDRNELEVFYQPIFNTATGCVANMEALLRWRHPRLGLVPPGQFIPMAEENGLIVPIGRWVMEQACREAHGWQQAGNGDRKVSVNVSAVQFGRDDLVPMVASILAETGLEPSRLELEVTESVVMSNMEESCRQMADLRALGISIAIDDFGTGYSTLSYLQHLPVDYLKIDQSFVRAISGEPGPARLVQAIVTMAHALGLKVTAEGVETGAQLEALRHFGCDQVQGFLLGRPMPVSVAAPSSYSGNGVHPVALAS